MDLYWLGCLNRLKHHCLWPMMFVGHLLLSNHYHTSNSYSGLLLLLNSIIARKYSMFCPTHANGPASYIRRSNDFWFSTTVSLLLLGRQENEFITWPDKNPTWFWSKDSYQLGHTHASWKHIELKCCWGAYHLVFHQWSASISMPCILMAHHFCISIAGWVFFRPIL